MSDSTQAFRVGQVATGSEGQTAHPQHLAHSERLKETFYKIGDSAWCYVGNGLSNQTFIKGPEGIIAIDTGECQEEMRDAMMCAGGIQGYVKGSKAYEKVQFQTKF